MRFLGEGHYAFDKEGVLVTVPENLNRVIPRKLPLDWDPAMWQREDFRLLRLVINLKFVNLDDPLAYSLKFSSPVIFRVHYTPVDRFEAQKRGLENRLAAWRGDYWESLEPVMRVTPVLNPTWAGYLEYAISQWDDPTIGIGY